MFISHTAWASRKCYSWAPHMLKREAPKLNSAASVWFSHIQFKLTQQIEACELATCLKIQCLLPAHHILPIKAPKNRNSWEPTRSLNHNCSSKSESRSGALKKPHLKLVKGRVEMALFLNRGSRMLKYRFTLLKHTSVNFKHLFNGQAKCVKDWHMIAKSSQ